LRGSDQIFKHQYIILAVPFLRIWEASIRRNRLVNLDTVNTKLGSVRERIMELQKREKDLSEQKAMMEDAATMKIIKKHKISPEQLQYLEQLSEDEILFLLEEKNKKNVQKTEIKEILTDEKEEIE
jgi:hypothetical protein